MSNPLVSIIIPVHNAQKFIGKTIQSAVNQTWPEKEIIIVNDGSTDNSLSVIQKFKGPNVQIIDQPNKGAAYARQAGLNYAKGDFVQYLDGDDLIAPQKIEKQVTALMKAPDKIAVCQTAYFFDDDISKHIIGEGGFFKYLDTPLKFLINLYGGYDMKGNMIQPNAFLTPRLVIEKAGPWNETLSLNDDGEYFCRVILNSAGLVYQPEALNYYRRSGNAGSLSSIKDERAITSYINSIWLNHQHLLNHFDAIGELPFIHNGTYRILNEILINIYYEHPNLRQLIQGYQKQLNPSLLPGSPHVGGKSIDLIAKIFGWKTGKFIQYHYHKLTN